MSLPTGTVTFLFTDIEGSARLWDQYPEAMREALERHDILMRQSIADHEGVVFKTMGDAFCVAFHTAPQALRAALTAQRSLQNEPWPQDVSLKVRIALHTGTAEEREGDYFGQPLNRVARLLSAGYGGQTLLSLPTYELVRDALPVQSFLHDLGAHSLRDLSRPEQVFQLCHPDLISEFPPLKSLDDPGLPNNLPQQLTSFVGREREMAQVKDLLGKTRLLTLTGSGGCGKTRLALQTAADVLDTFPEGVWLVELAPIAGPDLVPKAVADVLGVEEQPGKTLIHVLTESLKSKTMLLALDNCEHLLDACAHLSDLLLRACPSVKVLASSREPLNVAGEQTYRVPSLSLPDPKTAQTPESLSQYEAVRLFIDRAVLVKPEFVISNANAPALASVCHRVDGIPLAIELAAARIRSLSVEEVNTRLDNRFRLLTGGSRTALPRQQTLRALIDWSYDLLTAPEKSLLIRLSVFSGGWSLAASESVCVSEEIEDWEVLDLLASLVDKSLVQVDMADGQTRYRFLETVRQYARDRLAESDEGILLRGRHRDYFLGLVEAAGPKLKGLEQAHWFSALEMEHDNLRQALTFCQEQSEADDPEGGAKWQRLGSALYHFWQVRGHLSEGRERLKAMLSHPRAQAPTRVRANALNGAGNLAQMQDDYDLGWASYQESLDISRQLGDTDGISLALGNLGNVAIDRGDFAMARRHLEESLAICRELGDSRGIAIALNNLGIVAHSLGEHEQSQSLYQECLTIQREMGHQNGIASTLNNLGVVAYERGDATMARSLYQESLTIQREVGSRNGIASALSNLGVAAASQDEYELARSLYQESLTIQRELGDRSEIANTLSNLGSVFAAQGEYASAQSLFQESLTIQRDLDYRQGIGDSLEAFASLAVQQGNPERAARLFGAAEELRHVLGTPLVPSQIPQHDRDAAAAQAALGDEAFAAAWAAGRTMPWEQAVGEALGEQWHEPHSWGGDK